MAFGHLVKRELEKRKRAVTIKSYCLFCKREATSFHIVNDKVMLTCSRHYPVIKISERKGYL